MKYPKFLKTNDTIGIAAPSAGVGRKLESFDQSLDTLKKEYNIVETKSVRVDSLRSATAKKRAKEFNSLFNDDIDMVMVAAGGDFLLETLPYIDYDKIKANPKWIMGASDPTSILHSVTTLCDIATLYGFNAGSYDVTHQSIDENLKMLKGECLKEEMYPLYQPSEFTFKDGLTLCKPGKWISKDTIDVKGRCIGGCIDVFKDIIGTPFDGSLDFIERYKEDGNIWYFDNFALSAEVLYRTLLQMKFAGYFKYTKAVIIGREQFGSSETGMTYLEAYKKVFKDIPYVYNTDIGHTFPHMTLINGAMMHLLVEDNKGSIEFELI